MIDSMNTTSQNRVRTIDITASYVLLLLLSQKYEAHENVRVEGCFLRPDLEKYQQTKAKNQHERAHGNEPHEPIAISQIALDASDN